MFGVVSSAIQSISNFLNDERNRDSNEKINELNLQFQRENLDYQKALQQKIFDREDSAYARTIADMRNAGLSPLTMQGTNGAGEVLATTPLNAGNPNHFNNPFANFTLPDFVNLAQQYKMGEEEIRRKELENDYLEDTYDYDILSKRANLLSTMYDNLDKTRKEEFNSFFGINSSMNAEERRMQIYSRAFGLGDDVGINVHNFGLPLIRKHGKTDFYLNDNDMLYNGSTNYYVNPDTYAKAFTGKEMLKTGLDYASQFVKFFNIFNKKKSFGKNKKDDNLDWLPF